MSNNCKNLIEQYINWLHEQISISEIDGICEITTPFLDRHNDFLQIYFIEDGESHILSDGGYILSDLKMSGFDINTEKRSDILSTIIQGFGVKIEKSELIVRATNKDIAQKKHLLIQAMLAVNDLFVMAQPTVASLFLEDVEEFLNSKNIRFISKLSFIGKSGYSHYFDFAIPKSTKAPDRLIKAISSPNRNNISSLIFSWNDIRNNRPEDSKAIAFLNNKEKSVSAESINALSTYGIDSIYWSERQDKVTTLLN